MKDCIFPRNSVTKGQKLQMSECIMREMKNVYNILVEKPERKIPL
jgi:hypothetical protein